ncbi:MAG TPA: DUF1634 domain-containing protein [Myxococcota bacterium]|nr:DUF1634 domain-containing protein [Myxococcota bacterium]
MAGRHATRDREAERTIGTMLRVGLLVAAAFVLVGGAVFLLRHGGATADYRVFRGEPADLTQFRGILDDALALRGAGLIQLGILVLLGTPVARVAFSVLVFLEERDSLYVCVTLCVLGILLASLLGLAR